jgi:aspartyl-tRNA synthetase
MRKLIKDIVSSKEIDEKSENVYGWVQAKRDLGKRAFLTIKDRSGDLQVVIPSENSLNQSFYSINLGDVVSVKGSAKEDKRAPGGVELVPSELKVISSCATPTPIPLDHLGYRQSSNLEKRLDFRYLDLRNEDVAKIFKIKSKVAESLRKNFQNNDFIEIQTPKIVKEGAEGGTNLFPVEYFEKDAFLTQSPQFYKQIMMASGLERVYEIAPAFRAEMHDTPRHLNEFTSVDAEMSFIDSEEELMKLQEEMMKNVFSETKKYASKIGFEGNVTVPKTPFPRITLDDAYSLLKELKVPVEEDEDIRAQGEEALGNHFKQSENQEFFFLTQFPKMLRPLYLKTVEDKPNRTRSFDLIYRGMEITSGGQRINDYEELKKAFDERKIPVRNYSFYFEAFKYGMPPHGGFGLGLERLVKQMVEADNVREAVLFPRDKNRLTP